MHSRQFSRQLKDAIRHLPLKISVGLFLLGLTFTPTFSPWLKTLS
jgi:hypothetical protein